MNKFVITISRQYGSGGLLIAEKLSKCLNTKYYDKNLLLIAAKKSGLKEEILEQFDEKKRLFFLGNLTEFYNNIKNLVLNDTIFQIQSDIIKALARKDSAIFVGRCADYVLRDLQNCVNIFIYANLQDRIKRISENSNISEDEALKQINITDKERSKYYNYYTGKVWENIESYDLSINSSILGINDTANIIASFVKELK
ncbi:MAG: cytidylate kinase-like family protein [Endomicrobium sp.]|jgi:cytidylate kinase|nr:cytidylate kinase-like family protein [Endomicrobium sp.]